MVFAFVMDDFLKNGFVMAMAHHRPKRPDEVKERLLAAAMDILVDCGIQAVTLDAVAGRAGVTKGALIHHFKSRGGLLNSLTDFLFSKFYLRLNLELENEPPGPNRLQRAYIRTAFHDQDLRASKATGLLSLLWPPGAERAGQIKQAVWSELDPSDSRHDALRLAMFAAEGIWYAAIRGNLDLDDAEQERLMQTLLSRC